MRWFFDDLPETVWAAGGALFGALLVFIFVLFALSACQAAERGIASVYDEGTRTACGTRFSPRALEAAHRTLPCGTQVRVTTRAGNSVIVRITDRGPFIKGRIIDLTPAAAHLLRFSGLAPVTVEELTSWQATNNTQQPRLPH
jgi:rare lipoprotein A